MIDVMGERKKRKQVNCGGVKIGGGAPVSVQSMTNTDTRDVKATAEQIARLADAGCQIVRCAVPDRESAEAIGEIKRRSRLPLVADIHFDHRLALAAIESGADKVRINPGNIGERWKVQAVAEKAKEYGIPIRVGVNAGSLEKELLEKYGGPTAGALAESGINNLKFLEDIGFDDLVISMKSSNLKVSFDAHLIASDLTEHPFHIGVTEAGTSRGGGVKSAAGVGSLLLLGVGDTVRVSLTGDPVAEVACAREILKALGLRRGAIQVISCPTCGRCKVNLEALAGEVEEKLAPIERERELRGLPPISVAVMGCAVNGPGEAAGADIGVACGNGVGIIFRKGKESFSAPEEDIADLLVKGAANI
jgi:(E)-4-hydroxy-3-methylbut-2-enyl-diphosphate synthase